MATSDPIAEIIGDYRAFAAMQRDRLVARGIDIAPYALSHLAVRVPEWDQYVHLRGLLERHAVATRTTSYHAQSDASRARALLEHLPRDRREHRAAHEERYDDLEDFHPVNLAQRETPP